MHDRRIDRITRNAAEGISRRTSLRALSAAAIGAALAPPASAAARKRGKKRNKSCKKKIKKRFRQTCGRQIGECEAGFLANDNPDAVPCCASLATCDFATFVDCVTATD